MQSQCDVVPPGRAVPAAAGGAAWNRLGALSAAARWAIAGAALLAFALAFQGSRPLWEPDEGRYVAVALEMIQLDDYLVPRLHHQFPHFAKPPLTYWAITACVRTLGVSEWAVRLPNALAYAATVLLVFAIGRRLCPDDAGLAAVVYASFVMTNTAANIVTSDTLLTAFEALAVWGFASWWWGVERRRRGWLAVMWLGFALAFLTKGPVGLLPLLGIGALVAASDGLRGLGALFPAAGLALFALVGCGWYVAVVVRRPELVGYFLGEEFVGRVFTRVHGRNPEWYGAATVYLPAFLLGALPWTAVLAARLRHAGRVFRPSWWRRCLRDDPALFFALAWPLLGVLIFIFSRSRLHLYVLPLFPALALLTAMALRGRWRWTPRALCLIALWLALLVGLRAAAAHVPSHRDARAAAREVAALADEAYDEIVLVGVRNGYGLRFYLGREVEHVAFSAEDLERGVAHSNQTLEQELAESERQIFVVDTRRAERFEEIVRSAGRTPQLQGMVRGVSVYFCPR
ncbi:MAG TPA: glycosyltransferase family 39 protein [Thermoanaerobaculales bacterium]|nr:glycosyltransferase family 39 protein [Thermoanaerobaculales bacterium]HPA80536.1 glycosyltransferase family 39 protein [Thermoanaerobaculales bacterium]HQL29917.1 glycosyltransferase family 39 protein [Thermoanaerobaculales bacterium]HQN95174.1 glycosyltransferase family 39 protein [Thermoanaerobaculales bacterium]HQP42860.1 glycosyltransferase family 39 protein [Thermoanaerobaculales bacterium]